MIGRTDYQNVSGTRCVTDFCEFPSVLMEHFLASEPVLRLLLRSNSANTLNPSAQRPQAPLSALDTYTNVLMAMLDQLYHAPSTGHSSSAIVSSLLRREDPSISGLVLTSAWQTHFPHLYGYGATYYSYLFDRAIASRVWSQVFEKHPLSREQGERYKNEVLSYGGGKDPWVMISRLLDEPGLEGGDREAMDLVGRWGIME
jgi:intermediate peptidase